MTRCRISGGHHQNDQFSGSGDEDCRRSVKVSKVEEEQADVSKKGDVDFVAY